MSTAQPTRSCITPVASIGDVRDHDHRGDRRDAGGARSRRPGSTSRSCSAATASRARSCPLRRCWPSNPNPTTPTSTTRCPATSAAAAPICAFARPSSRPRSRRMRRLTMIAGSRYRAPRSLDQSAATRLPSQPVGARCWRRPAAEPAACPCRSRRPRDADERFAPNAFVRIGTRRAGRARPCPRSRWARASTPSMPMLIAEELEVDLTQVQLEHAPPNDKLYGNPLLRRPGDRRLDLGARGLGAAARGRRDRPHHAGCRRGQALEGRCRHLPRGERRGHPRRDRPQLRLWRAGRRRRAPCRSRKSRAQGAEGLQADRHAGQAPRHAGQGQRHRRLRHRCAARRA